ncbi:nucleoside-diphosphate kinase [Powellomyces hirtus]|uniref:Nucleoside diphosphate kinase n=1 Tax=Powellomyces hirtus TaxID=109895 RepID=A0A507EA18_9FUNG|nr:nucleoside-diphosphate kinase [Powellomyces hirtus]
MAATTEDSGTRFCFLVDWYDGHADLSRSYQLFYFPVDQTIEMYDVKQRRSFLKRTRVDLRLQDLYIGAAVNVNARQLVIRGYGDEFTQNELQHQMERTLMVIKPNAFREAGEILDDVQKRGFTLCRLRMLQISRQNADSICRFEQNGASDLAGGRAIAVELMKPNAVGELVANFNGGGRKNVYIASSAQSVQQGLDEIFNEPAYSRIPRTAVFQNSTLALIRPHAVNSGMTGQILNEILKAGYEVNDMELFRLENANAEEFLEVYKGVVPEYHSMLNHLTSGPVIALEISGKPDIVNNFREFCGPMDPELGRVLRPQSIRAQFGSDKVHNAIHCTDLDEDGPLEIQYFFRILVT